MSSPVRVNSIRAWVLAARPKTLAGAATPVIMGGACAWMWLYVNPEAETAAAEMAVAAAGRFDWLSFALCMLFAWIMQIDANFVNDYFDFRKGGLMGKVHQYLVDHLDWDGNGTLLDIGCGGGALTIRCARRFPRARITGTDYWGPEWSYAKEQCEQNARLEHVADRLIFCKGDAAALEFPDGAFDAAVSNFVFHEVRTQPDKRKVVRESLRVVKKGGSFAFQDLFSQKKLYRDMEEFIAELKEEGIGEIHYIPFVERQGFIPGFVQAPWMLYGIGLIYGKK